jgi:hypothetical protein
VEFKKRNSYKQGIILDDSNSNFFSGQLVDIISEGKNDFLVKPSNTHACDPKIVDKKIVFIKK